MFISVCDLCDGCCAQERAPRFSGLQERVKPRPSVFYRLLESEGANALDAWAAAEARGRPCRREPVEDPVRQVRRTFRENWQYLCETQSSQVRKAFERDEGDIDRYV